MWIVEKWKKLKSKWMEKKLIKTHKKIRRLMEFVNTDGLHYVRLYHDRLNNCHPILIHQKVLMNVDGVKKYFLVIDKEGHMLPLDRAECLDIENMNLKNRAAEFIPQSMEEAFANIHEIEHYSPKGLEEINNFYIKALQNKLDECERAEDFESCNYLNKLIRKQLINKDREDGKNI